MDPPGEIEVGRGPLARRAPPKKPLAKAGAKVSEVRLANGLRVLTAERRGDPVVASVLYYGVGARNEAAGEEGMSHFLEHMMFKGAKRFGKGEVDRVTTELGGQNNAFTGYDHTAYWFELASDRWEAALEIEADRMTSLLLDGAEFEAERDVVLEELAMGEDDPWRVLSRLVERAVFPGHPYGRPIIGYPEALRRMTPGSMRSYYERFYHPGNATLVVAGDVGQSTVLRAARAHFGRIRAGVSLEEADRFRVQLREPIGATRLEMTWDDEQRRLALAWPTVPVGTDGDYALDLALVILAGGRLSRLQKQIVYDSGLATNISASNDTRVESGAFWLFVDCASDADPVKLEHALGTELEKLRTKKPSAAEMKHAKSVMRTSEAFDGETVSDLAEELGEWAVDFDWRMAFDGSARHERVTAEEVRRAVERYLAPSRRVTGWCHPRRSQQGVR